jgi:hypothetical protein
MKHVGMDALLYDVQMMDGVYTSLVCASDGKLDLIENTTFAIAIKGRNHVTNQVATDLSIFEIKKLLMQRGFHKLCHTLRGTEGVDEV